MTRNILFGYLGSGSTGFSAQALRYGWQQGRCRHVWIDCGVHIPTNIEFENLDVIMESSPSSVDERQEVKMNKYLLTQVESQHSCE